MNNTIIIEVFVGVIATLLTAVINKPWWTTQRRQIVSLVVSVVLGAIILFYEGSITTIPTAPLDILQWVIVTVGGVMATAQIAYNQLSEQIAKLEAATSGPEPKHAIIEE